MTSVIERVARAIVGPHRPVPAGSMYTLDQLRAVRWGQANNAERQNALNEARAAIEAMREPDPNVKERIRELGGTQAVAYWLAGHGTMIDAALAEQQS